MRVSSFEPGSLVLLTTFSTLAFLGKCIVALPGGIRLDLYSLLIGNTPLPMTQLAMENFCVWFSTHFLAYILLYVRPQRSFFHPFKLNKNYPPSNQVLWEFARCVRGVAICTLFSAIINSLHMSGSLPYSITPNFFRAEDGNLSTLVVFLGALIIYGWGDTHFYWTHRLLHTRWLYRNVHMIHHQSYNPNPFSGLSMHWIESTIYFSSAPMVGLVAPLWMFRLISMSLLLLPVSHHLGFGFINTEGSLNHYIHHTKFNWNYGSSRMWDHIMGTSYCEESFKKKRNQQKGALEQAAMVDCKINAKFEVFGLNIKKVF